MGRYTASTMASAYFFTTILSLLVSLALVQSNHNIQGQQLKDARRLPGYGDVCDSKRFCYQNGGTCLSDDQCWEGMAFGCPQEFCCCSKMVPYKEGYCYPEVLCSLTGDTCLADDQCREGKANGCQTRTCCCSRRVFG